MSELSHYAGGRKTKLTDSMIIQITTLLEKGHDVSIICDSLNISEHTFINWMHRGEESNEEPFFTFHQEVIRARAEGAIKLHDMVMRHAEMDPRSAQWLLERRFPQQYGRKPPETPPPPPQQHHHVHILATLKQQGILSDAQMAQMEKEIINSRSEPLQLRDPSDP